MEAMKRDVMEPVHKGSRWHGWKLPPSVRLFKLEIAPWNDLLTDIGLKRRLPHNIKWRDLSDVSMRRFMQYQIKRLDLLKTEPELYWQRCENLIRTSVSFRVAAYNKIAGGWWHEKALGQVWLELRRIERLLRNGSYDLKYKRVYIDKDKSKGTFRPLGVPTLEWRVIMHMWNNFLTQFLRDDFQGWNHGFQPGLGTMSAWKSWILKAREAPYIYEFDLQQFFPSVKPYDVTLYLQRRGVPSYIATWLEKVNNCQPQLPKERKLDESAVEEATWHRRDANLSNLTIRVNQPNGTIQSYKGGDWVEKYNWLLRRHQAKGLPQGLNTSPILSLTALVDWQRQLSREKIFLNMYADDGMMYSYGKFTPPQSVPQRTHHIMLHPDKSRWIKYDGIWQTDRVKYLGLEYLPKQDLIRGSTRKGSTLEFDSKRLELIPLLKKLTGTKFSRTPQDKLSFLAESGVFGLVQAKLYQGDWEELDHATKAWARHPLSWYQASIDAKGHPTMSSRACQYLSKIVYATMKGKLYLKYK